MADCTDPTMGLLRILRYPALLGTLEQSSLLKILRYAAKKKGSLAGEFCVLFKEWTLYKRTSAIWPGFSLRTRRVAMWQSQTGNEAVFKTTLAICPVWKFHLKLLNSF